MGTARKRTRSREASRLDKVNTDQTEWTDTGDAGVQLGRGYDRGTPALRENKDTIVPLCSMLFPFASLGSTSDAPAMQQCSDAVMTEH